jgi:hypothetical protein
VGGKCSVIIGVMDASDGKFEDCIRFPL